MSILSETSNSTKEKQWIIIIHFKLEKYVVPAADRARI